MKTAGLLASFKMCVRELIGKNVHTWHRMLGYCQKDQLLSLYAFHLVGNITDKDLLEGQIRYLIYGAGSIKNCGVLKPGNLLSKISLSWSCECGAEISIDVISELQQMLKSGLYFPTMTWIKPVGGHGSDQTRLEVLYGVNPLQLSPALFLFWNSDAGTTLDQTSHRPCAGMGV